eukprot:CAMPEP_0178421090 /NCGR_PEP_ID=MMETSP0689_2-20121128/26470_1 /TAXON_ID=160604 /ORGANISM="Amphidinium massartii, Strain CS-259" /LENGTH=90 /DNA_ID=CAMNT_0020042595 /DNA_START=34 /DNA_END=303 /DNA_ORIENTATION=-
MAEPVVQAKVVEATVVQPVQGQPVQVQPVGAPQQNNMVAHPSPHMFGDFPMACTCPNCHAQVQTNVQDRVSAGTHIACIIWCCAWASFLW